MSNAHISKLLVVNWGSLGFNTQPIMLYNSNLFGGESGSGKTTTIDALIYLLFGIKNFNANAEKKKGRRTEKRRLIDYVRGNVPADDNNGKQIQLRPKEMGDTVSYIIIEAIIEDRPMVAGACIESAEDDKCKTYRFVLDDTLFEQIQFYEKVENKIRLFTHDKILHKGKKISPEFIEVNEDRGIRRVLRALGIKDDGTGNNYKNLSTRILQLLTATTDGNINEFIKENIFPAVKIDSIGDLKELRSQYTELQESLSELKAEVEQLNVVDKAVEVYEQYQNELDLNLKIAEYQSIKEKESQVINLERQIDSYNKSIESEEALEKEKSKIFDEANREYESLKNNPQYDEIKKRDEYKSRKVEDEARLEGSRRDLKELEELENRMSGNLNWIFSEYKISPSEQNTLLNLTSTQISANEKEIAFSKFSDIAQKGIQDLAGQKSLIDNDNRKIQERISELEEMEQKLRNNEVQFPKKRVEAKKRLEKALSDKTGKVVKTYFFAELILGIKDESWRQAIESELGNRRYDLYVDDQYFKLATNLLKQANVFKDEISIIRTNLLHESETREGSAAAMLEIERKGARMYANALLNNLILFDEHESDEWFNNKLGGLTRDGYVAKGLTIGRNRPVDNYCLGDSSIKVQLKLIQKEKETLKAKSSEYFSKVKRCNDRIKAIQLANLNKYYSFDAANIVMKLSESIKELSRHIKELDKGHSNFIIELERAEKRKDDANQEYQKVLRDVANLKSRLEIDEGTLKLYQSQLVDIKNEYEQKRKIYSSSYIKAEQIYLEKVGKRLYMKIVSDQMIDDIKAKISSQRIRVTDEQYRYRQLIGGSDNVMIGVDDASVNFYRKRLRELSIEGKIDDAIASVNSKKDELQSCFINTVIGELNNSIETAYVERDEINEVLRRIPFGHDVYRFVMKEKPSRKVFFDIIQNLSRNFGNQYRKDIDVENDPDIQDFMSLIIDEDDEEMYTDYRNYFDFGLKIRKELDDGNYAEIDYKGSGKLSGGEGDCPNYIILAASLMRSYSNEYGLRIAFVDEAFSTISSNRIRQLVEYFKDNNIQVIYCTPDQRVGSIGPYVDCNVGFKCENLISTYIEGAFDETIREESA